MVVYCVEFVLRPDGKFDAQQYFGQHFRDEELLCDTEPPGAYEVYQFKGDGIILPESVLTDVEKAGWLERMRAKLGEDGMPYACRRAI
ncbi:MAG TPA: hypothetical protein VHN11_02240 [Xanthobacteraceae bacterium]|jgi:hypothetical protein|nr:hypothetical protein [Xanthobacteraceae bacterium]